MTGKNFRGIFNIKRMLFKLELFGIVFQNSVVRNVIFGFRCGWAARICYLLRRGARSGVSRAEEDFKEEMK